MTTVDSLLSSLEDPGARLGAITALIDAGDRGEDLAAAIPSLVGLLRDPDLRVAKEAIWAVYVATRQGHTLDGVVDEVRAAVADRGLGNGQLALALHELNHGRVDEVVARMDEDDATVQFGVAHALTDFAERTQDRALVERVLRNLKLGIVAPMLNNGVAASILDAIRRTGRSFAGEITHEVANAETDPVAQAPMFGVLMKVSERLRR